MKSRTATYFPSIDLFPNNSLLLDKILENIPALIVIYNIKTGKYIYVNNAIEKLLGYKKTKFLKLGLPFVSTLVHPEDITSITKKNIATLKIANSRHFPRHKDNTPITFEYRMRHRNGTWKWLHSDGVIFSRNQSGKVEYVMNISVDITERKKQEIETQEKHSQAEEQKNILHQHQLRSMRLRNKIFHILRQADELENILKQSLEVLLELLPATFSRVWLVKDNDLELFANAGNYPPLSSIKQRIGIGEYAVGLVASQKKPFITNNIYQNNRFHIQNIPWSKKNKIQSFAGYPLFFKNRLVGVIGVFATNNLSESTLDTISYVADIFAQEIERRRIEKRLQENQIRYSAFITQSSEGIWRFELEKPVSIKTPVEKQIRHFYQYAYLAECNDALARMYGFNKAEEIIGARLGDMLLENNPDNLNYLKSFILSGFNLSNAESAEIDKNGRKVYFQNSLLGIVEKGYLVRAWGTQRDITDQKESQFKLSQLSQQKDEFIAIASHELKTPVTSLKAYTQVVENRLKKAGDESSALLLHKMDAQLNKITSLIGDLLDISKMEAGKLQFNYTNFSINDLINEIIEEMQQSAPTHTLIKKLTPDITLLADRERIGQVLINFISNAVKYSPNSSKVIIKTGLSPKSIRLSVQDFGIGISSPDQKHLFERFYRGENPDKQKFPGLGLGLYICKEIIGRHHGKIGVRSHKSQGSTFFFILPLH